MKERSLLGSFTIVQDRDWHTLGTSHYYNE